MLGLFGAGGTTGDVTNNFYGISQYSSISAIKGAAAPADGTKVVVGGYADNGGTIIAPTAGSGRWKRIYSGAINVRWFGAKGDGETDDATAIQAALTAAPAGGRVVFPPGVYRISATLTVSKKLSIDGSGASLSETTILAPMLALDSNADGSTVRGLAFVGSETIGTFPPAKITSTHDGSANWVMTVMVRGTYGRGTGAMRE